MFNIYKAEKIIKIYEDGVKVKRKENNWMKRYKTEIRQELIGKHERRITGFAKKMESQPVILPEPETQRENATEGKRKCQSAVSRKTKDSFDLPLKSRVASEAKFRSYTIFSDSKYTQTKQSFRDRNPDKEINPPMKYGSVLSKQYLSKIISKNKKKKAMKNHSPASRKQSQEEHHSIDQLSDINHSDFDVFLAKNAQQYVKWLQKQKNEKKLQQQQELKALSHDKLYFKSLMHFREKTKDALIQQTLDNVLIKCKVVKPPKERLKKEETEDDFLAEIMKLALKPISN